MTLDYIIPAKTNSERVPNKNFREFVDGKSLVDLVVEKLIAAGADRRRIHLSSESERIAGPVVKRHGINFLKRSSGLCDNSVPLTTWMRTICGQVAGESDIAWCQVCDPMFDSYEDCLQSWRSVRISHDSLVVCRPWRGYLMTEHGQPIGWSFGEHHTPSQRLPEFCTMPFTLSILTREAIAATGYHVGKKPYWYSASGRHVDIDDEFDFAVASAMASHNAKHPA